MVELFCGMLSGSDYGPNIPPWRKGRKRAANLGQCFVCLDPAAFGGGFSDRMSDLMKEIRNLPPVEADKPVLAPGEPEKIIEKKYREHGISLHRNLGMVVKWLIFMHNICFRERSNTTMLHPCSECFARDWLETQGCQAGNFVS